MEFRPSIIRQDLFGKALARQVENCDSRNGVSLSVQVRAGAMPAAEPPGFNAVSMATEMPGSGAFFALAVAL